MMARPLLLVGAGGLAREVLAALRAGAGACGPDPIGVLDDDPARHGTYIDGVPVLGPTDLIHDHASAAVVVCVANPHLPIGRLAIAERLGLPADRWATVVHPSCSVPQGADLGPGTVLLAGTVLTTPSPVGAHVLAMPHVVITHDDVLEDGVTLAGRA